MTYDNSNLCTSCRTHFAEPHAPNCPKNQPATIAGLNAMNKLTIIAVTEHKTL